MTKIHIQNTDKEIPGKTLCGERGEMVYAPTKSNCDKCIEKFKEVYPDSYEQWVKRESNDG